jgi:hypothetical protein
MAPHPNPLPASLGEGAGCAISRCPSGQCLCPPLLPCPSESKELPLLEVLAERVSPIGQDQLVRFYAEASCMLDSQADLEWEKWECLSSTKVASLRKASPTIVSSIPSRLPTSALVQMRTLQNAGICTPSR